MAFAIIGILFFAALIFTAIAQINVTSTYQKYNDTSTECGMTAEQVARRMLDDAELQDIEIEQIGGELTDHFDPREGVLRLSTCVYGNSSVAAIGVAAHEAGHAIQHARGYIPVKVRSVMVPVTNFASKAAWVILALGSLLIGLIGDAGWLVIMFAIALYSVLTAFQVVTLPVEFNASGRALRLLRDSGDFSKRELGGMRKVLRAAAMTYVAAMAASLIQLLRLILIFGRRRK